VTAARATDWSTLPIVLDVEMVRALTGLSRNGIYAAVKAGELPSLSVGRRLLIPRDRLRAMIEGEARS